MIYKKKKLSKMGTERNFFNLLKGIYEKPTANNILNGEKYKCFCPKIWYKARMSALTLLFNIALKVLAQ